MSQIDQSRLARERKSVLCCVQRFMLLPSGTALRGGPELIWISQGPTAFLANRRRFLNSTVFFVAAAEVPVQNHNGVYFSPTEFSGMGIQQTTEPHEHLLSSPHLGLLAKEDHPGRSPEAQRHSWAKWYLHRPEQRE